MSQIQSRLMTPDEFLAWEAGQELKWEFDGFQPVAMTGGTFAHAVLQGNLVRALNNRLAGTPCRAFELPLSRCPGYLHPDSAECRGKHRPRRDLRGAVGQHRW